MNGKVIVIVGAILVIIFGVSYLFRPAPPRNNVLQDQTVTPTPFEPYEATFAIYTNGTLRTFTAPMYHNQHDKVFITKENPTIVNVRGPNITWQQFFDTLPMTLTPTCLTTGTGQTFCTNEQTALRFFRNGTEDSQLLSQIIKPHDRILISYGLTTEVEVRRQYQAIPLFTN